MLKTTELWAACLNASLILQRSQYAHRLWDFSRGLFLVSFSTIFEIFKINEDFVYSDALTDAITALTPFQGCET